MYSMYKEADNYLMPANECYYRTHTQGIHHSIGVQSTISDFFDVREKLQILIFEDESTSTF